MCWLPALDAVEPVLEPPLAVVLPLAVVPLVLAPAPAPVDPDEDAAEARVPVTSTWWPLCCESSASRPSRTYVDPLMAMPVGLPLPAVPAVAPGLVPVEVAPPAPVLLADPVLPGDDALPDAGAPEPMRALVSMNCELPMRELLAVEPAVPLVPVAPAVPLVPPPLRHPVTVIVRLPAEV